MGAHPEVPPAGVGLVHRDLERKERVPGIEHRRREDGELAVEHAEDLAGGAPDGGGRRDDLGPDLLAVHVPRCQPVDCRLVKAHHGPKSA